MFEIGPQRSIIATGDEDMLAVLDIAPQLSLSEVDDVLHVMIPHKTVRTVLAVEKKISR